MYYYARAPGGKGAAYVSVVDLEVRHAGLLGGLFQVLGEELTLLIEVVGRSLQRCQFSQLVVTCTC